MRYGGAIVCVLSLLLVACERAEVELAAAPGADSVRRAATIAFWSSYRAGLNLVREDRLKPGRDSLHAALALDPAHEGSLYHFGNVSFELGRYADAGRAWQRLVSEHPHSARGFAQLGALHACGQDSTPFDLAKAQGYFQSMYQVNKESSEATVKLGEVALLQGRYDDAIGHLDKAIAFDAGNRDSRVLKGFVLWMQGDRAAAAAVAGEDRASASEKDRPFASEEGDTRSGSKPMLVSGSRPRSLFRRTIDRIASGESPVVVYAETQDRVSRVLAAYRERDGRP